jgi:hypothetical protein
MKTYHWKEAKIRHEMKIDIGYPDSQTRFRWQHYQLVRGVDIGCFAIDVRWRFLKRFGVKKMVGRYEPYVIYKIIILER